MNEILNTSQNRINLFSNFSVFCFITFYIFYGYRFPLNHDIGWLYTATEFWLEEKSLYSDIVEVNPPFIFYLFAPVVLFKQTFDIPSIIALKTYTFVITLPAIVLSFNLIDNPKLPKNTRFYLLIGLIMSCFSVAGYDFGQRDHLAIIFLLPYFISSFNHSVGNPPPSRTQQGLIIVFATVAICLKPYFIAFFLGAEIWRFLKNPSIKNLFWPIPCFISIFTGIFYVYLILIETSYLTNMVPLAIATYWTYGTPLDRFDIETSLLITGIIFTLTFKLENKEDRKLIRFFIFLSLIGLIVFLIQSHYSYQLIPHKVILTMSFCLLTIIYLNQITSVLNSKTLVLFASLILIFLSSYQIVIKKDMAMQLLDGKPPSFQAIGLHEYQTTVEYIDEHFADQEVYVFSSNVWPATFISHYTKAIWTSGFPALWPLPAIDMLQRTPEKLTNEKKAKIEAISEQVMVKIFEEINDNQPKAIFIESSKSPSYFTNEFDYKDFIQRNPKLREIFQHYEKTNKQVSFMYGKTYDIYLPKGNQ
ncbi:hypothetical protein [Thalassotalea sp. Y01]|uniref:hypothetical protein n=1 Tax=Thalassotalea sp. Y01 TaxID=2729613 RepID=UPI00145DA527|nr:hypothetical protein [Thalassotalea sp. Y01]NMP14886.1 hypothetical protein [Thalassotalea sp. Y01]